MSSYWVLFKCLSLMSSSALDVGAEARRRLAVLWFTCCSEFSSAAATFKQVGAAAHQLLEYFCTRRDMVQ